MDFDLRSAKGRYGQLINRLIVVHGFRMFVMPVIISSSIVSV